MDAIGQGAVQFQIEVLNDEVQELTRSDFIRTAAFEVSLEKGIRKGLDLRKVYTVPIATMFFRGSVFHVLIFSRKEITVSQQSKKTALCSLLSMSGPPLTMRF